MALSRRVQTLFPELRRTLSLFNDPFFSQVHQLQPNLNLSETASNYNISVELPGILKEDIDLKFNDNSLMIQGKVSEEKASESENLWVNERMSGEFQRRIVFPDKIDEEGVKAVLKDGVLKINVPKTGGESQNVKSVQITQE